MSGTSAARAAEEFDEASPLATSDSLEDGLGFAVLGAGSTEDGHSDDGSDAAQDDWTAWGELGVSTASDLVAWRSGSWSIAAAEVDLADGTGGD